MDILDTSPPSRIALVIPVHNEARFIEQSVKSIEQYIISSKLEEKFKFTIIIAEDGSTDNSYEIIKHLATEYENIVISHSLFKLGRGRAVKEAWKNTDAEIYIYLDADMSVPVQYLNCLIESCNNAKNEIVTGSRYIETSRVRRPFLRKIISMSYNSIVNLLFKTGIRDHQCGFKGVRKNARDIILTQSIFDDWFWDTEIFVIAKANRIPVREFPIEWEEKKGSKTPILRLLSDMGVHGLGIAKLLLRRKSLKAPGNSGNRTKSIDL